MSRKTVNQRSGRDVDLVPGDVQSAWERRRGPGISGPARRSVVRPSVVQDVAPDETRRPGDDQPARTAHRGRRRPARAEQCGAWSHPSADLGNCSHSYPRSASADRAFHDHPSPRGIRRPRRSDRFPSERMARIAARTTSADPRDERRHFPFVATYSGSRPRISQAPRTASRTGTADSTSRMRPGGPGDLVQALRDLRPSGIAEDVHRGSSARRIASTNRGAPPSRSDLRSNPRPSRRQDRDSVVGDRPLIRRRSRARRPWVDRHAVRISNQPIPAVFT